MAFHVGLVRLSLFCVFLAKSVCAESVDINDDNTLKQKALDQKIHKAIVKFEQTNRKQWGFTVNRFENEEGDITESVEQFTPNADINKRWLLISANGEKPTVKQQEKFLKAKRKQASKKKKRAKADGTTKKKHAAGNNSYSIKLRELINQETLSYQSETSTHIQMSFQVTLSQFGDDTKGKLDGLLSYNKQDAFIETITITNNAPFSPMFSASISELLLTFNFTQIDDAILFREHALEMKGTFAYFVEIDEVSKDSYFGYQYNN